MLCFIKTYKFLDGFPITFVQSEGKITKHNTKLYLPKYGLEVSKQLYIIIHIAEYPPENFLKGKIETYQELKTMLGGSSSDKLTNRSIDLSKLPADEDEDENESTCATQ
mgnify:CR=1 FL=1